jgi:hypothetical protein
LSWGRREDASPQRSPDRNVNSGYRDDRKNPIGRSYREERKVNRDDLKDAVPASPDASKLQWTSGQKQSRCTCDGISLCFSTFFFKTTVGPKSKEKNKNSSELKKKSKKHHFWNKKNIYLSFFYFCLKNMCPFISFD